MGLYSYEKSQTEEYNGYLWNGGDRSKNISYMKMDERKALVKDYLDYIGFDYSEYTFGDVYQKSNNNFGAESAFSCNVTKNANDWFTVWLESDGTAINDRFMIALNPVIQDYITEKITEVYPKAKVSASAYMFRKPSKEWTVDDGAEEFLKSGDNYRIYIDVVLGADSALTQPEAEEKMKSKLGFLNSADFSFYKAENPDEIQPEDMNRGDAVFGFTQSRDR